MKTTITLLAVKEDRTPEKVEKSEKYAPGFAEAVRKQEKSAKELRKGSQWGWCTVELKVRVETEAGDVGEGTAYLGECSYTSDLDFMLNSGYYDDILKEATAEAMKNLKDAIDRRM